MRPNLAKLTPVDNTVIKRIHDAASHAEGLRADRRGTGYVHNVIMNKITADTITSKQIRALADRADFVDGDQATLRVATLALNEHGHLGTREEVRAARARCAEILNAREFWRLVELTKHHGAMCPCDTCKKVRKS